MAHFRCVARNRGWLETPSASLTFLMIGLVSESVDGSEKEAKNSDNNMQSL
jgi:hypothetical protein